ncbi:MAG: CoA-binding protein [Deltaproteobacteria bacterium]|uniref:CoA-binding protein n=1 Tax=Candidatus Zymogenus saltonus TaxID=2844893 RepID=A0A9D8PMZ2_9DELT|nr:CoA-binding protein [Candidatus Zymogenus saltonus]
MKSFFAPESVAVVGATGNKMKGGYHIFNNLVSYYNDRVYPVNPNYTEIDGHKVYPSVSELPEIVELVIIFTPAVTIPAIVEESASLGIKRVQIQAAGFAETGDDGKLLADRVMKIAKENGIRIWGPNCTGSVNSDNLFFAPFMPVMNLGEKLVKGNVSIVTQTGMLAAGFLVQVLDSNYFGIDKAAAIGNKMDVDEVDILEYLAGEDTTGIILMYLESINRGREFLEVAERLKGKKAIVLLKGGRSPVAVNAALSHTGSLAGDDGLIAGALNQAGVARVCGFIDMMNVGRALSLLPTWNGGKRIGIITISGGAGIVTADLLNDRGIDVPELTRETTARLQEIFPPWMPPKNPVDIWPTMEIRGINEALEMVVPVVMADENIDAVILLPFASPITENIDTGIFERAMMETKKPVLTWMFGFIPSFEKFKRNFEGAGVPVFKELNHIVSVVSALRDLNR